MVGTNTKACPKLGDKFAEGKAFYANNTPTLAKRVRYEVETKLGSSGCGVLGIGRVDAWKGNNLIPANDALKAIKAHGMDLPLWASVDLATDAHTCAGKQIAVMLQKNG
eukprot:CAMPEP_0184484370 /NCGR_PEP_ID=MMETSP0113_2-20130426/6105_1 /TAXON_ID=91329 /ORGANISM="Norrisiella sphaerica, Strain BC52" /LENGTH=108 /DNA_ID=CAMNT_0026865347 /DNA_START=228 /DNA_END=551 /DNA_ORIENTATION=+